MRLNTKSMDAYLDSLVKKFPEIRSCCQPSWHLFVDDAGRVMVKFVSEHPAHPVLDVMNAKAFQKQGKES